MNLQTMTLQLIAAACVAAGLGRVTLAQHAPAAHGSMDAMTVLPTTGPTATQPMTMPAGHPAIPAGGEGSVSAMHQGMAAAKTGALRVNVSQGTRMGPAIGNDSVRVELLAQGVPIKTYLTAVNAKGVIELHDLPLDVPFQPVISILHEGAEQQKVGPVMHKYQPAIEFDMPVYETTSEKPAWTIGLRNIEVAAVVRDDGNLYVQFTDMLGGFDPDGKAWIGEKAGDALASLALPLPAGAKNLQYGPGMAEASPRVVNGVLYRGKTMVPGSTQYVFAFDIAVKEGKAAVTFAAPVDTTLFALYVPGEWKVEKATGAELAAASGAHATGKLQLVKGKTLKADSVVAVELSGIKMPAPVKTPEAANQQTDLHLPVPSK